MRQSTYFILLLLINFLATVSCQTNESQGVLATKDGYSLTEKHFSIYIQDMTNLMGGLSKEEKDEEKEILIEMFMESPTEVIALIGASNEKVNPPFDAPSTNISKKSNSIVAKGNYAVRQILGSDIGQMQFDSKDANAFRAYLQNSLLTSRTNSYNSGGYRSSNANITFNADGTFLQALSGHVSVDVPGASAGAAGTDYMPGNWEVASLPNGLLMIIIYSTHPSMLEDSPNGLLPLPVAQYTQDFVALPNGDGYHRSKLN